jgi:hypothetical protein
MSGGKRKINEIDIFIDKIVAKSQKVKYDIVKVKDDKNR